MAALMRMSRNVKSNTIRCLELTRTPFSTKSFITKSFCLIPKSNTVQIPALLSRHQATLSISESLLREKPSNQGNDPRQRQTRWRQDGETTLEDRLTNLDGQMRRIKRVDLGQLFVAIGHAEKIGSVTEQQALVLIRACGTHLAKENVKSRQDIFQQIWDRVEKLVPKFDISHYNAALKVRLENKEKMNPADVLANIEENMKLFPNRITYQLLIAAYCEQGDLEGAKKILEHMRSQDIAINEAVFHALIRGHMRQGDVEGAKEMLSSMRQSGLLPQADTYATFMCGYAEKGDLAGINQTLAEADTEEVSLYSGHMYQVVTTLLEYGHSDSLSQLLTDVVDRFSKHPFDPEVLNCAFRLVALGKDAEALTVFKTITNVPDETYRENIAGQLLEAYAIQDKPLEQILQTMEELKKTGYVLASQLRNVAQIAIKRGYPDTALEVCKTIINKGEEIKRSEFYPLYRQKRQIKDVDGLCSLAGQVVSLFNWDINIYYDILSQVIEPLVVQGVSREEIYAKLKEHGLDEKGITKINLLEAMRNGQFVEAKELLMQVGLPGTANLSDYLAIGFRKTTDIENLAEFISTMQKMILSPQHFKNIATSVLQKSIRNDAVQAGEAENLVKIFIEQNFVLNTESSQNEVMKILKEKSVESGTLAEIEESFKKVTLPEAKFTELNNTDLKTMAEYLEKSPESIPPRMKIRAEIQLLKQYCRDGDVEKADKLISSLDSRGFQYGMDLNYSLGIYYAKHKHDLEMAQKFKEKIKEERSPPHRLQLHMAKMHVEAGNMEQAVIELREATTNNMFKYELVREAEQLLQLCLKVGNPQVMKDIVHILFTNGYVQHGTNTMLDYIMRAYLDSDQPDEIVSAIEEMGTQYSKLIYFHSTLRYFVEREDAERLQKVVDLASTIRGEMEILHHLVFAFVECGKIRQAKKILETPGLRAQMSLLNKGFDRLHLHNKNEELEHMVNITKDLFGINREEILFWLIRMYAKHSEAKKALDVLTRYEEEAVMPRHRTLRYLAKVLESNNMDVPFEVPAALPAKDRPIKKFDTNDQKVDFSSKEEEILKSLEAGEVDKALQLRDRAGADVRVDLMVAGVQRLFANKQPLVTRELLTKLADKGDVDSLLHMRHRVGRNLDRPVHKMLFQAYFNSNQIEELLNFLDGNIGMLPKYLDSENVTLISKSSPEIFEKFVQMLKKHNQSVEGNYVCMHHLYNHYLLTKNIDEAHSLIKEYPDMTSSIHLRYLIKKATDLDDENIFHELMNLVKGEGRAKFVFARHLEWKCQKGELADATAVFEDGRQSGMELRNFGVSSLEAYQSLLETNNKPVPWTAENLEEMRRETEQRRKRPRHNVDSDSDHETETLYQNRK